MSAFLLRLPLELRFEIYQETLLSDAQSPTDYNTKYASSSDLFTYWRDFQPTYRTPTPASVTLQLCCRQMHVEIQSFLEVWLKKHNITFEFDLKFERHLLPQVIWTYIPVPVKFLDRLEIKLFNHNMVGPNQETEQPILRFLVRLLATFIRTGPSLQEDCVGRPIPFLNEIVISYHDLSDCPTRLSPEEMFQRISREVTDFGCKLLRGTVGKVVAAWDQAPQSTTRRVESGRQRTLPFNERHSEELSWICCYDLPRDWSTTQRAAYQRNRALNSIVGYEKYPTLSAGELHRDKWPPWRFDGKQMIWEYRPSEANNNTTVITIRSVR